MRYGPGHYAPAPNGRGYDCSVCVRSVRVRARMPDEVSARAWIDAQEAVLGTSRAPLTRAQMLDAQDALAALPPGVTLLAASRAWLALNVPEASSEPFGRCVARYLDRRRGVLRPSTFSSYLQALKRLGETFPPETPADSVTQRQIEDAVSPMSPHSRNGALRVWSAFFRWAVAEGACRADPCAKVSRARIPEPPKGILTPAQARALLAVAVVKRRDLVPYLAVGLFAGVRPAELLRLRSDHIGPEYIRLDGSVAKTSDARTVPIRPNLSAWLKAYPPEPGRAVCPVTKKRLHVAIRKLCAETLKLEDAAGRIQKWPSDCMRHSYASFAYELDKNAAAVAASMGHRGTDIFFRHYRALALPGDGKKYFGIRPGDAAASSKRGRKKATIRQRKS